MVKQTIIICGVILAILLSSVAIGLILSQGAGSPGPVGPPGEAGVAGGHEWVQEWGMDDNFVEAVKAVKVENAASADCSLNGPCTPPPA